MIDPISFFKEQGYYHGKNNFSEELIRSFKGEFDPIFAEKRKRFYARFHDEGNYGANHDINRWNMLLPSNSRMLQSAFYAEAELFELLKSVFEKDFALVFSPPIFLHLDRPIKPFTRTEMILQSH